jgi:hypothetical protein
MKKALFSLFLFAISSYLWSQSDPYFKLISIPADIEKQAQIFLQSTCDSIQFIWKEELPGGCKDGNFIFILPLKYTYKQDEPYTVTDVETYTEVEPITYMRGGDEWIRNETVTKQRSFERTEYHPVVKPTREMMLIKKQLFSQKKYNSSIQLIQKYKRFDKTEFQDSVKNEINTKYSNQEYKKYIKKKNKELQKLIKEWETVPLTDAEIKAQKNRIRSSWRNFDQERAIKLNQFNSECLELFEAKRFVYKYEHDIP